MRGADVFLGLSKAGLVHGRDAEDDGASGRIVFALANPDPEIGYDEAKAARPDAIVATGRSDYPNQVNNVLGFPFIFRGALDVRAKEINEEMKLAAAHALAELAHEPVPDSGRRGLRRAAPSASAPTTSSPSRSTRACCGGCAPAVAEAAMESGVARLTLDIDEYRERLQRRIGGAQHTIMRRIVQRAKSAPKRIVFPEGDNIKVLRACQIVLDEGIAQPDPARARDARSASAPPSSTSTLEGVEIVNPADSPEHAAYVDEYWSCAAARG